MGTVSVVSFQPPPPGTPPPPPPGSTPPGGWQQPDPPPGGFGAPPPPAFATPAPGLGPDDPPAWGPPPAPAKKSRKGLFLGLGLVAAVILIGIVVALASVANKVSGGTALADLRRGDCFNTSKALVADKATRVPCEEPHTDEVAGVLSLPGGDKAAYPGQSGILEFGKRDCVQQVTEFYGEKQPLETTQVFVFGPNEAAWKNGGRAVVCSLREESTLKRTGSYLAG